jgi:hypothetical protein
VTKREAAIVSAYTGFLLGRFQGMHEYAEAIMGRPVFTHEFGNPNVAHELRELSRADFRAIKVDDLD